MLNMNNDGNLAFLQGLLKNIMKAAKDHVEKDPNLVCNLGEGFSLMKVPDSVVMEKLKLKRVSHRDFGYLFKDGVQVSEKMIFRKGGVSVGFKDGYCNLILYMLNPKTRKEESKHVIINSSLKIVLTQSSSMSTPYHLQGCLAAMDSMVYDLKTGKPLVQCDDFWKTANYVFVQNKYNKDYPKGVYKIDSGTGTYEFYN